VAREAFHCVRDVVLGIYMIHPLPSFPCPLICRWRACRKRSGSPIMCGIGRIIFGNQSSWRSSKSRHYANRFLHPRWARDTAKSKRCKQFRFGISKWHRYHELTTWL